MEVHLTDGSSYVTLLTTVTGFYFHLQQTAPGKGDDSATHTSRSWLGLVGQQELYNYLVMPVEVNERYTHNNQP